MDNPMSLGSHVSESLPSNVVWGKSTVMQNLFEMTKRVAVTSKPTHIAGPTGSGKEIIAQLVHSLSPNANAPFVAINCAAIPESLFESELFGYEKGAFTGATQNHEGYMSAVKDGTLFFDEIGDLPLNLQTKILRVLETKSFTPVGSTAPRKMRGRIISASHKDLSNMVNDSSFREDLFYRLSVFILHVPGLNERRSDIPHFINHFAKNHARDLQFTSGAIKVLSHEDWPGNIRQLRNVIDRIAVLTDDDPITEETVEPFIGTSISSTENIMDSAVESLLNLDIENILVSVEYRLIDQALQRYGGNKSKAAQVLGIHRKCVERRILTLDNHWAELDKNYLFGKKAMEDSDYRTASIAFKKALNNISKVPYSPRLEELKLEILICLSICLRTVNGWKNPELSDLYQKALDIGEKLNKNDSLAAVYFGLWTKHLIDLELDQALHFAQEYLKQGKKLNSMQIIISANISIANSALWLGDVKQCLISLQHFIEQYEFEKEHLIDQGLDLYVYYLMFLSVQAFQLGKLTKAKQSLKALEILVESSEHAFTTAIALETSAWIAYLFNDIEASFRYADRGVKIATENSFPFYQGLGLIFKGYALACNDQLEKGAAMIIDGFENKMCPNGGKLFHSVISQMLGKLYCSTKTWEKGLKIIQKGIEVAQKHREILYLPELLCVRSEYHIKKNNTKDAIADLENAISIARDTGSLMGELNATNLLADLYIKSEKPQKAKDLLSCIIKQFKHENVTHNQLEKAQRSFKEL